jgi:hypothetical protein
MTQNSEKMLSVGALFFLSLTIVGFEQGMFFQTEFPLCDTSLQPLVQDLLFAAIYIVGSLQLLFLVFTDYLGLDSLLGGTDNSETLKGYARKYVTAVFFLVAIEAFIALFANINIGCMTPGFPPQTGGAFL